MNTFTSESVCNGHPDKICDQVSDAILDEAFKIDRYSRVAVETMVTKNFLVMAGEVTTKAELNYKKIAQRVVRELGYTIPVLKFSDKSKIMFFALRQIFLIFLFLIFSKPLNQSDQMSLKALLRAFKSK